MMRKFLYLFIMLSFACVQVQALQCQATCAYQEEVNKVSKPVKGHECCHGKNTKSQKEKKKGCHDGLSGACFHDTDKVSGPATFLKVTQKVISFYELPILIEVRKPQLFTHFHPKIPNENFLTFKSRQDLYLIKDQFLI